ncbi:MAG: hypothetical protein Q4P22_06815, partial [Eubacteriales bacterium]|nr:hypothetical protein [Eubacteriales bacterium]
FIQSDNVYSVEDIEILNVYSANSKKIKARALSTPASAKAYTSTPSSKISIKNLIELINTEYNMRLIYGTV